MALTDNDKVFLEKLTEDASFVLASSFKESISELRNVLSSSKSASTSTDEEVVVQGDDGKKGLLPQLKALSTSILGLTAVQAMASKGTKEVSEIFAFQNQMAPRMVQIGKESLLSNNSLAHRMGDWGLTLSEGGQTLETALGVGLRGFSEVTEDYLFGVKQLGLSVGLHGKQMAFQTQVLGETEESSKDLMASMQGLSQANGEMGDLLVKAIAEMSNTIVGVSNVFGPELAKTFQEFSMKAQASVGEENRKSLGRLFEQLAPTTEKAVIAGQRLGGSAELFQQDPERYFRVVFSRLEDIFKQHEGDPIGFQKVVRELFGVQNMDVAAVKALNESFSLGNLPNLDEVKGLLQDDQDSIKTHSLEVAKQTLETKAQADNMALAMEATKKLTEAFTTLAESEGLRKTYFWSTAAAAGLSQVASAASITAPLLVTTGIASGGARALGGAGALRGLGKFAARGSVVAGAGFAAKDLFDVVTGSDGGATGENIGGVIGSVLGGAIGLLGGPMGVAAGLGIGNFLGNLTGGLFDGEKQSGFNEENLKSFKSKSGFDESSFEPVLDNTGLTGGFDAVNYPSPVSDTKDFSENLVPVLSDIRENTERIANSNDELVYAQSVLNDGSVSINNSILDLAESIGKKLNTGLSFEHVEPSTSI